MRTAGLGIQRRGNRGALPRYAVTNPADLLREIAKVQAQWTRELKAGDKMPKDGKAQPKLRTKKRK